jgi:hypothetical protein
VWSNDLTFSDIENATGVNGVDFIVKIHNTNEPAKHFNIPLKYTYPAALDRAKTKDDLFALKNDYIVDNTQEYYGEYHVNYYDLICRIVKITRDTTICKAQEKIKTWLLQHETKTEVPPA